MHVGKHGQYTLYTLVLYLMVLNRYLRKSRSFMVMIIMIRYVGVAYSGCGLLAINS